jgi:hypothetical protein
MSSLQPNNNLKNTPLSLTTPAGRQQLTDWAKDLTGAYNFMGASPDGIYFDVMAHCARETDKGYLYVQTMGSHRKNNGSLALADSQAEVNCYVMSVVDDRGTVVYTIATRDRTVAQKLFLKVVQSLRPGEQHVARDMVAEIRGLACELDVEVSVKILPLDDSE